MNSKIADLRYQKTEQSIQEAFWKLMYEVGFNKISVQGIIELAKINRSTFYDHYCDKYQLLDTVENNMLTDLDSIMKNIVSEVATTHVVSDMDLYTYLTNLLSYFYEHGNAFDQLINQNENSNFHKKIENKIKELWCEANIYDDMAIPSKYAVIAVSALITSMITEWIHSGFEYPTEEFSGYVCTITNMFLSNMTNIPVKKQRES